MISETQRKDSHICEIVENPWEGEDLRQQEDVWRSIHTLNYSYSKKMQNIEQKCGFYMSLKVSRKEKSLPHVS